MNELAEVVMSLAKIFAVAALFMTFFWGYYTDTSAGYLGGYNWYTDSQVFEEENLLLFFINIRLPYQFMIVIF